MFTNTFRCPYCHEPTALEVAGAQPPLIEFQGLTDPPDSFEPPRMRFISKFLRAIAPHAAGLALAFTTAHAATTMPETPSDVAAPPADAVKTASGLASKVLQAGKGDKKPAAADTVTVHYSGWTTDGKLFDSSVKRGQPASFPLNGVIKGWTEGLQLMVEGEKRRFWIPGNLAYGENPGGGRPGGMLVFDVELLGIKEAPKPPAVPEDVAAAPGKRRKNRLRHRLPRAHQRHRHRPPEGHRSSESPLLRLDHRRQTLRQLRHARRSHRFPAEPSDPRLDRRRATHGRRRKTPPLDPRQLAYGENPPPARPPARLVFDVELLEIVK